LAPHELPCDKEGVDLSVYVDMKGI